MQNIIESIYEIFIIFSTSFLEFRKCNLNILLMYNSTAIVTRENNKYVNLPYNNVILKGY